MSEGRVLEALKALAENDRQMTAPPSVEASLTEAFRTRRASRIAHTRRQTSLAAVCAFAAAAAILIVVMANRPPKTPPPERSAKIAANSPPAAALQTTQSPTPAAAVLVHRGRSRISKQPRRPVRNVAEEHGAHEVVTDFFALMDPAPPMGRGEILRVQVPAMAMRAVGLPVSEDHLADRIQADVLVGEEGLPRAIRFVKVEMR